MMTIDFGALQLDALSARNEYENQTISFVREWFSGAETVEVQTSGSTGRPKILHIEKVKMQKSAELTVDFLHLKHGDSALLCLPIAYISGKMVVVRSIVSSLHLVVASSSLKPLEALNREIDFCAMTPLQVENSLDKIHLIRKLIIGGASVSESLKKKIKERFRGDHLQSQIFETYGMSETLSHIALKQIYPTQEDYFTTFQGVDVSIDSRGCLQVYAPHLNDELLVTNDLVEFKKMESGDFSRTEFRFLGRIDNVINSGGAKIFPEELEALAKKEIENEIVFLGIPDQVLGQKLIAVVEFDYHAEPDCHAELVEASLISTEISNLESQISNLKFDKSFHRPKEIRFIKKFPRTPNGKVLRNELMKKIKNQR